MQGGSIIYFRTRMAARQPRTSMKGGESRHSSPMRWHSLFMVVDRILRPNEQEAVERQMPGGVTMELNISDADTIVLRETLGKAVEELTRERAFTENRKMRVDLEKREEILKGILAQIPAATSIAA